MLAIANVLDSAIPRDRRRRALHPRRPRDRRRLDQVLHHAARGAAAARRLPRAPARHARRSERAHELLQALVEVPNQMREVLGDAELRARDRQAAARTPSDVLFLGRGLGFPIALEGALKLKEISYAHAEGYAAGEMKHGPIALIDEHMPVVVRLPRDRALREDALATCRRCARARAQVIAVATEGDERRAASSRSTRAGSRRSPTRSLPLAHGAAAPAPRVLRRGPQGHRRRSAAQPREDRHRRVKLPPLHRDPFDRMLVSHAIARGLTVVTPDPAVRAYPCLTWWG